MNHCEPTHSLRRARKAWYCLSLPLLAAIAPVGLHAQTQPRPFIRTAKADTTEPTPYLRVKGAPALRFQEPAPPPDLVTRPAAGAPPTPALTPAETSVALANAAAAEPAAATPAPLADKPAPKVPAPILRDDTRPTVRPEDFLPYFQIPGSAQQPGEATLIAPAPRSAPIPATLPPSSATYRQTK